LWTNFPAHKVAKASRCGPQILLCITGHDGRTAGGERNRRGCSDGFEIGCHNGEQVRVALALDCCDREAMSFLATTSGVSGEDVRDSMLAAVEHRFGVVNRLPVTIEWLSDNGSCYLAGETTVGDRLIPA
jgi:putative transposase